MKLYFYILNTPYRYEPYVQISECEVVEKPKTYKPVNKFPDGYYGCYVRKEDIGHLIGYSNNTIVLTEKNNTFAKEMFKKYLDGVVEKKKSELEKCLSLLDSVSKMED